MDGWITLRPCAEMGDPIRYAPGKSVVALESAPNGGTAPSPDHTAELAFFVALGFVRFVASSSSSSRWYPGKVRRDLCKPLAG